MGFPASPSNGQIHTNENNTKYRYNSTRKSWDIIGGPTLGGEVNDGANVGVAGVGVYDGKTTATLNFRKIRNASSKVSVVLNTQQVDLDVVEANISHTNIGGKTANDHHSQSHDNTDHSTNYKPDFTENTGFNKDLGTGAGEVAEGNHGHTVIREKEFSQEPNANIGQGRARSIGATGANRLMPFRVPDDFVSLVKLVAIFVSGGTFTSQNIELTSEYGGIGELFNTHGVSALNVVQSGSLNQNNELNLATAFASLSAGDLCHLFIDHKGIGQTLYYKHILLKYNASVS